MDLTPEQVHAFVGPKADYYLERWSRIQSEAGSRTLGFNWAAGLLTMSWLLYRRMYRWFWIAVAVWVGLTIIEMVALETAVHSRAKGLLALIVILSWITPVVWIVMFGRFGTYWYYRHTRDQIAQLTPNGRADLNTLSGVGGTDWWAAILSAAVFSALALWGESLRR